VTVRTYRRLLCDGSGCEAQLPGELLNESIAQIQARARHAGWRAKRGKNFCPHCVEAFTKGSAR
jgi:hypothetical protein